MKLVAFALGLGLVGASAVSATPYYVGEVLRPQNNVSLNFHDTPTKSNSLGTSNKSGNIAVFEIGGDYMAYENLSIGATLPFYSVNEDAAGKSRTSMGNINMGVNWNNTLSETTDDFAWGYALQGDLFLPTSRKTEAGIVAGANPATHLYGFTRRGTTADVRAGLFAENEQFEAKTNVGYGWLHISDGGVGSTDKNRATITWQTAGTWRAIPEYLNANLEYNAIWADKETFGTKKYRHGIAPSVSGEYEMLAYSAFVNVPLDSTTRDINSVSLGFNVGYTNF